jgi:osmoprotectant transport system ATP-binding protein
MLIFESVVKHYGRRHALGPLSLRVPPKSIVAVTGPPGAGKTTLLRLALGLTRPDAGIVIVGGMAVTPAYLASARRKIGYVPRAGALFPHLSVAQNILLATSTLGWSRDKRTARLASLCETLRFSPANLERHPHQLSGVERRRVAFLRALVLDPDLLLIDEPFAELDAMSRYALRSELAATLRSLGKAILFASESLADCAAFGEDVVLLRGGLIAQRGSAADLSARPTSLFVSEFVKAQRGVLDAG